jgi:hypothetical protein
MASADGIISANYLKTLLDMQENLIIKPVRFLTRKHLYPSNLEKMKVYPAVQIFHRLLPHRFDILLTITSMIIMTKNFLILRTVLQLQNLWKTCINTSKFMM